MKQKTAPLRRFATALAVAGTAALAAASPLNAAPLSSQALENTAQLCTDQTARLERSENIPAHLLTAVSLTETGRWQKGEREIIAWPWTVTAQGRGRHFDSKQEALLEVEVLLTEGVTNIDVGCMQINLAYHPDAFASLADALDPKTNTRYAATFLKSLYAKSQDWMTAVGSYHSNTPDKNLKYRAKLVRLWNKTRGLEQQLDTAPETTTAIASASDEIAQSAASRDIDHQRIRELNKSFRERRNNDPVAGMVKDRVLQAAMKRQQELDIWRERQVEGLEARHIAAMRRAEQKLYDQQELATRDKPSFEERRQLQLGAWRESNLWVPN
ncbi:MAG: transglycosylase SLT domain-containing protein [Rhodospirillales bacterium]|nr:transglycosylase SLT domain-containing protein [Rhodospirillales bacterium]